jgi:DNA-binding NarL/FixJ family response regulator
MGVTVVLADDHALVRGGLRRVLEEKGISVIGEADNGHQALQLVKQLRPQVAVMDVAMPEMNGLEATRLIKQELSEVQVVVVTMYNDPEYIAEIIRAGAIGCVLKQAAEDDLVKAVEAAARSESYFSPAVATMVLAGYRTQLQRGDAGPLTEREREILTLVAEGYTNKEIACHLSITIKTVETHRANIMNKLGIHDLPSLVRYAVRRGLVADQ